MLARSENYCSLMTNQAASHADSGDVSTLQLPMPEQEKK
jgi:hypothetical protein